MVSIVSNMDVAIYPLKIIKQTTIPKYRNQSSNLFWCDRSSGRLRVKDRRKVLDPLSAKFKKWSNILKQFVGKLPTNCLIEFDHFVGLSLKGLIEN